MDRENIQTRCCIFLTKCNTRGSVNYRKIRLSLGRGLLYNAYLRNSKIDLDDSDVYWAYRRLNVIRSYGGIMRQRFKNQTKVSRKKKKLIVECCSV